MRPSAGEGAGRRVTPVAQVIRRILRVRMRTLLAATALTAALAAIGTGVLAQQTGATNPPAGAPKGPTPRAADGHPDLTGLWRRQGDPSLNNVVGRAFTN